MMCSINTEEGAEIIFSVTFTILNNIHRPVLHLKHDVSETALCVCLQVVPSTPQDRDRMQSPKIPSLNKR
jgi:hypothetical protein